MTDRVKLLDDLGAEFARVATDAERRARRPFPLGRSLQGGVWARAVAIALGAAVLLSGVAYAVPVTRTVVDGIAGSLAAWVAGQEGDAPGRALRPGDDVPRWFSATGEARLIAKTDGIGLYVRRSDSEHGPYLDFGLGEGLGLVIGGPLESWREHLDQHAVHVLGPALVGPRDVLDDHGRAPLLGLTTRDVEHLELRYADGPPLVGRAGDGGFVLMVDAWRPLRELTAYDAADRELERIDVSGFDLRYLCEKEPACPDARSSSSR